MVDERLEGIGVRRYVPARGGSTTVVFAHGGYGIFGDVSLQDGPCRALATALGASVVSVDYRLAPEHSFGESAADVARVARAVRQDSARPTVLWGDSAGGALVVAACASTPADAVILTNPNLDLTLGHFDADAPDGPNLATSRFAFAAWARGPLQRAPRLHEASGLPPLLVAVGTRDALVPECRRLVDHVAAAGGRAEMMVVPGAGHGLLSDDRVLGEIACRAERFVSTVRAG